MILDTNIYGALLSGSGHVGELVRASSRIALPLPVVAELRDGFLGGSRCAQNELALARFIDQDTTTVLFPTLETAGWYAELRQYAKARGRVLSNNDVWIAALAQEADDLLVTYDRDFLVFQDVFGDRLLVLE